MAKLLTIPSSGEIKILNPFAKEIDTNCASSSTWYTSLSITGEGWLRKAIATCSVYSSYRIKITIDGIIIHYTIANNNNMLIGILPISDLVYNLNDVTPHKLYTYINGFSSYAYTNAGNGNSYPSISGLVGNVFIGDPIPFKSSLLVEVMLYSGTGAIYTTIQGGTY